jgi:hypothetical protein
MRTKHYQFGHEHFAYILHIMHEVVGIVL